MEKSEQNIWPKKITVDKKIVKILSESTYDSFPHSVKELIINGYDADAINVHVSVDLKKQIIKIEDDGFGMTIDDFDFYLRIAGQRREKGETTSSGRPIVGQFGVGFLSVFPFFLNYSIETKKSGYSEILYADIPCYKYFAKERGKLIDVGAINITGGLRVDKSLTNKNFTKITLSGFTPLADAFFNQHVLSKTGKNSVSREDGISKLKWYLEDDLPLRFDDEIFSELFKEEYKGFAFQVFLNNTQLKRRIFGKVVMEQSKKVEILGNIKYKYFLCSNEEPVNPSEATGFKIRNLNIGVGKRTTFGLGVETGGTRSRLRWLTGEIHIIEGLNDEIKVARDDFYFTPEYEQLKMKFASLLSSTVGILEAENNVRKFLSTNQINDLRFLENTSLSKKIERVRTQKLSKPQIKLSESNKIQEKYKKVQPLEVENFDVDTFQKKYIIKGQHLTITSEKWNYKSEKFPACKIIGDKIIINKSYPLFSKQKHLDIFVRLNVLLVLWLKEKKISDHIFSEMSEDILKNFSDYYS